jgi:hypothetical protein
MDDEDKTDDESMMMPPPGKSPYKLGSECDICHRRFHNADRLQLHKEKSHGNEMVMQLCTLCRRYFPGSTCLQMHQKTHHKTRLNDDIILKCSYCSGVFHEQASLEEHVRFFHLEEECLICGHVSVGAFESYEHIGEFHSPLYIPGHGHHCIDGASYPHRHHAVEHFRRKYVYHWNLVSMPKQVHSCPHSQIGFDSWAKLHKHVMSEHNSYGQYYDEPDYSAVEHAEDEDELTLLPCLICNEFYHDQISLDKHVANDHEPFATRRPFSDKTVKFDIPNIQHAAKRTIPDLILDFIPTPSKSVTKKKKKMQMPSPDVVGENIMAKIMGKIAEKPGKKAKQVKEPSPEPEPEPETPQKLTRSEVKKIIIPKKSTLLKRARGEAKRKAKIIEAGGEVEEEKEALPDKEPDSIFPKKDGDNSKLDTSNILSEGGRSSRHANKAPQEQLPQVGSGRAAATNATVAMAASTGRSNRFAKALERRAQLQEQEKKGLMRNTRQAASQVAIKAKKETPPKGGPPPKVNLYGPKGGRRYLTKDDSDLDNDKDAEVLPTKKRRGPGSKKQEKKESSSEEESDSSEDEKDANKNKKNSKPTPKRKPGRPAAKPAESASESSEDEKEVKKNKKPVRTSLSKRLSNVSLNMMKPRKKVPAKVEQPVSSRPRRGLKKPEPSEEEASSEEEPKVKKDNKKVITPSIKKKGKQPEAKPDPNFDWKSLFLGAGFFLFLFLRSWTPAFFSGQYFSVLIIVKVRIIFSKVTPSTFRSIQINFWWGAALWWGFFLSFNSYLTSCLASISHQTFFLLFLELSSPF